MTDINDTMNQAIRSAAGFEAPAPAEAPAGPDTMNQAIRRQAAGFEAPAPAEAPDETPGGTQQLRALRDELVEVGGDGLAVAQHALDEAQLTDALRRACAGAGVPGERVDDVRALIDLAGLKRNLGGQPSAASVARQVAQLVERLPGLADEPLPPKPRQASWDGGARTSGPLPRDRGAEVMAAVREVVDRRRGSL